MKMVRGYEVKDTGRQNVNVPERRVVTVVSRERDHKGAPFILCKSEDIPLIMDTVGNRHLRDMNNTALLSPSKDAIVPSGATLGQNKYQASYGQTIFEFDTSGGT